MNRIGRCFQSEIIHHFGWDDTLKEKRLVAPDDLFLVVDDVGYCRAVRLADGHVFHFCHDDVDEYLRGFSIET